MISSPELVTLTRPLPGRIPQRQFYNSVVLASQIFLGVWLLSCLAQGLVAAFWFDGYPVNGPFQIFDPLRRIAAGQTGGKDFVFFHGIGVPYLHYPLFALFGGKSLAASELSRQWTSILLFALSLYAFMRAAFGKSSKVWLACAAAVIVLEAIFRGAAFPGHSLVAARSAMPVFAFAILQTRLRGTRKAILLGGCIALAFLFGTEHALSLTAALMMVAGLTVLQAIRNRAAARIAFANLRFAVLGAATAVLIAAAILCGAFGFEGAWKAVYYSLAEVPGDQFWFFSSPPMPYLGTWADFLHRHSILTLLPTYFTLALLAWMLYSGWRRPVRIDADWQASAAIMLIYGLLSGVPLLGILSKHYVFPLARVLILVAALVIAKRGFPALPARWRWQEWKLRPEVMAIPFITTGAVIALVMANYSVQQVAHLVHHLRSAPASYSRTLDDHWDRFMSEATALIDSHRTRQGVSLWSAYSALLESHYGVFHPAQDYIIHALGPRRWPEYVSKFRSSNPEFVTIPGPQFDFSEWLEDERWDFYEDVVDNYVPLKLVEHAVIWQRKPGPWTEPAPYTSALPLDSGARTVSLPRAGATDQIAVVQVHYTVSNRLAWFPLLGKTPRYLALVTGTPRREAISFPAYVNQFRFPVELPAGSQVSLEFKTESLLPGVAFHPDQVWIKSLNAGPEVRESLLAPANFYRVKDAPVW